jgi:hypothetical protein
MVEKRELYIERSAREVWGCDKYGNVRYYDQTERLDVSNLFPNFPNKIVV